MSCLVNSFVSVSSLARRVASPAILHIVLDYFLQLIIYYLLYFGGIHSRVIISLFLFCGVPC